MTTVYLQEYHDWAIDNTTPERGASNNNVVDSATILLASVVTSLLAQGPDLPVMNELLLLVVRPGIMRRVLKTMDHN